MPRRLAEILRNNRADIRAFASRGSYLAGRDRYTVSITLQKVTWRAVRHVIQSPYEKSCGVAGRHLTQGISCFLRRLFSFLRSSPLLFSASFARDGAVMEAVMIRSCEHDH